ncbi:MAG: Fis family transcriptional regulator [Gammaproteobacteria bacterium HGW-Gammaproteobacteria-11]|nr:MAG: Fis family transcriptional regulator [Gammaproteobacteria bacterium HGW-Gammaproteobacteria-11]
MENETDAIGTILELEDADAQPLSIRAKALVFSDPVSKQMLAYLQRVSPSDAPVLIKGETGTGKELLARHVHQLSGRKGPFVAVNCGAINEQLAESELFGHEQGSFTGASSRRAGWFEAANGGTLFLDEVGDLPLSLQVKILRVIQEREVVRVGSREPVAIDVRLITATNVDLEEAVRAGHFRLDLLYRLNIVDIRLPPLRERTADIRPLAEYFLKRYATRLKLPPQRLADCAIRLLEEYSWPGNIRELENVIHHALLVSSEDKITGRNLKLGRGNLRATNQTPEMPEPGAISSYHVIEKSVQCLFDSEQGDLYHKVLALLLQSAYQHAHCNQVHSARLLGISRNTFRTLLKKHGVVDLPTAAIHGMAADTASAPVRKIKRY